MPSYKFTYFDFRGRGELCRLLFHAAGMPFEDIRLNKEEVEARKPSFPFGQVPVLEVDGEVYAQSINIATYLAREFGFYGKTNLDGLKIGQVLFHLLDIFDIAGKALREADEARKEQFTKEATEEKLPKALGFLDKLLEKNGTGYFVGSEMTVADIAIYDLCTILDTYKLLAITQCPNEIQKLVTKVSTHPKLVKYLSERSSI